jgi:hypothetical protein
MKIVSRLLLALMLSQTLHMAILSHVKKEEDGSPKDRNLFLRWSRNEEFFRHQDRERCKLSS